MNYELWIEERREGNAHELNEWNEEERKAVMNYELWIMNWKKKKGKEKREETKKNMPTNETNETKRREKQLWIMSYELRAVKSEEWRVMSDEWLGVKERKMNYELWIMNYELKKKKGKEKREETKKNMPTNETNETKRRKEQLWIMNYELWRAVKSEV